MHPDENLPKSEIFVGFYNQLKMFCVNKPLNIITDDKLNESEYILGCHNNRWYLAYKETQNIEMAKSFIKEFVCAIIEQTPQERIIDICNDIVNNIEVISSNVHSNLKAEFNYNNSNRVIAKTAFNCLAYLKGSDFMLRSEFNPMREAIYNGEDMNKHFDVMAYDTDNDLGDNKRVFGDIFRKIESSLPQRLLNEHYHCIFFFKAMNKQKCAIGLYGFDRPYILNLAKNPTETVFDAFICDWRNEKEMNLINYIAQTINKSESI